MADPSNAIPVPKPNRKSYNPSRPLQKNTLLLNQVRHFIELEKQLPPEQQTGTRIEDLKTEAQASEYAAKITSIFHPQVQRGRM